LSQDPVPPASEPAPKAGPASGEPARPSPSEGGEPEPGPGRAGGALRYLFYALWLVAVPLGLGLGTVWALTPGPSDYAADWFRGFVGEQQVPALILFFTLFAMVVWRFRYALPLAGPLGVLPRSDVPPRLRARFDDAAQLLSETRRILHLREEEVQRALSRAERDQIRDAIDDLHDTMSSATFEPTVFLEQLARADKLVGDHLSRWRKGELREYLESIGVAVLVALVLRVFVIEAFKIPSGSMIPTLMVGDHIFVAKYAYGPLLPFSDTRLYTRMPPSRGDVMVFKFPENKEQDFIKRAVAVPGDKLEALDGRVVLNGWLAPHCYVGRMEQGHGLSGELYLEHLGDRSYVTMFDQKTGEEPCATDGDCGAGRSCRGHVCGMLQGPYYVAPDEVWAMGDNRNNSHDSRSWRNGMGAGVPFRNIKGRAMFVWMAWNPSGGVAFDRLFVSVMGQPRLPSGSPPSLQGGLDACLRNRPPLRETTPPAPTRP
jgi:signal peptidase I